eukprot:m51a1_g3237 hypothetical protein (222) ;mRNA; f:121382-122098
MTKMTVSDRAGRRYYVLKPGRRTGDPNVLQVCRARQHAVLYREDKLGELEASGAILRFQDLVLVEEAVPLILGGSKEGFFKVYRRRNGLKFAVRSSDWDSVPSVRLVERWITQRTATERETTMRSQIEQTRFCLSPAPAEEVPLSPGSTSTSTLPTTPLPCLPAMATTAPDVLTLQQRGEFSRSQFSAFREVQRRRPVPTTCRLFPALEETQHRSGTPRGN